MQKSPRLGANYYRKQQMNSSKLLGLSKLEKNIVTISCPHRSVRMKQPFVDYRCMECGLHLTPTDKENRYWLSPNGTNLLPWFRNQMITQSMDGSAAATHTYGMSMSLLNLDSEELAEDL